MSTYSRPRTKRQFRHPSSRSKSHRLDKQEGEVRQRTVWVGMDAPERPCPKRTFPGLQGHEYTYDGTQWRRCEGPEEFADYIEAQAEFRSSYKKRTTRKGVEVEMKRPVATPIEVLTTTCSPWLSQWTAAEIAASRDPRPSLAAIRNEWLQSTQKSLAGQRYLLGYAFHADTDDLHFDLIYSRQDGKGGRIGKAGLGLVGPWCTAVDRQTRAGADISGQKRDQLRRSAANFRHRSGEDAIPLDVTLARSLDAATETVLGAVIVPFKAAYAANVPLLERQHIEAKLASMEAVRERLLKQVPKASVPDVSDARSVPENHFPSFGM